MLGPECCVHGEERLQDLVKSTTRNLGEEGAPKPGTKSPFLLDRLLTNMALTYRSDSFFAAECSVIYSFIIYQSLFRWSCIKSTTLRE